jgi:hypothetical protein
VNVSAACSGSRKTAAINANGNEASASIGDRTDADSDASQRDFAMSAPASTPRATHSLLDAVSIQMSTGTPTSSTTDKQGVQCSRRFSSAKALASGDLSWPQLRRSTFRTSCAKVIPRKCFLTAFSVLWATQLMMLFMLQLTWHCLNAFRSLTGITGRDSTAS